MEFEYRGGGLVALVVLMVFFLSFAAMVQHCANDVRRDRLKAECVEKHTPEECIKLYEPTR